MARRSQIDQLAEAVARLAQRQRSPNWGGDRRSGQYRTGKGEVVEGLPDPIPTGRARKPFARFKLPGASAEERAAVRAYCPTMWGGKLPAGMPDTKEAAQGHAWDTMMIVWRTGTADEVEAARRLLTVDKLGGRNDEKNMNLQTW